jgi:uncharacterized protein YqjF (DUF2071 family)
MLNYEVDASLLHPFVPAGTDLDCWQGKTFLSLVGFRFLNTKVFGMPFPFHRNFDEVNLRFYVRRLEATAAKRGVVFVREIVPRWAIAAVARGFYSERYLALPMSHRIQSNLAEAAVEYGWKSRSGWNKIALKTMGEPVLPEDGSQEQFITEHYWGYARGRQDSCIEYRVEHPQWKVWRASEAAFEGDAEELYGKELAAVLTQRPYSAFLAEGSIIAVYRGLAVREPTRSDP